MTDLIAVLALVLMCVIIGVIVDLGMMYYTIKSITDVQCDTRCEYQKAFEAADYEAACKYLKTAEITANRTYGLINNLNLSVLILFVLMILCTALSVILTLLIK